MDRNGLDVVRAIPDPVGKVTETWTRPNGMTIERVRVPLGVVGEMCIGGIGVSPGYINLPDLTRERFVADPFVPGGRMFRTGDLGRLLPSGDFEILGRRDDQVKLKGYRIELDEVAAALMKHPRVTAAAAVVKDKTHLVGFVVPQDIDADELRDVAAAVLPAYMVPAVFVAMAEFPMNANGKADKDQLVRFGTKWLDLEAQALRDDEGNEHPLTASEFGLLKVFAANPKRVLSRERLLELANARDAEAFDRAVDLRIMRIRRKIEIDPAKPAVIRTIRGGGYLFSPVGEKA